MAIRGPKRAMNPWIDPVPADPARLLLRDIVSRGAHSRPFGFAPAPMQTKTLPEIESSELKSVRQFLTSLPDEERQTKAPRPAGESKGSIPLRNGITRARSRPRVSSES